MKNINFRGKRRDNNQWAHGLPGFNSGGEIGKICQWYEDDGGIYYREVEVIPETITQFTGEKDKKGIELVEGDIIKQVFYKYDDSTENEYPETHIVLIEYSDGGFHADNIPLYVYDDCEIIGNIFDNPELLKK